MSITGILLCVIVMLFVLKPKDIQQLARGLGKAYAAIRQQLLGVKQQMTQEAQLTENQKAADKADEHYQQVKKYDAD